MVVRNPNGGVGSLIHNLTSLEAIAVAFSDRGYIYTSNKLNINETIIVS